MAPSNLETSRFHLPASKLPTCPISWVVGKGQGGWGQKEILPLSWGFLHQAPPDGSSLLKEAGELLWGEEPMRDPHNTHRLITSPNP